MKKLLSIDNSFYADLKPPHFHTLLTMVWLDNRFLNAELWKEKYDVYIKS